MLSIKPLLVAAGFLAVCQTIGGVHAQKQEPPQGGKTVPAVEASNETKKNYTPEDYWVPLDNWLKHQGSPLNGKDFYEVGQQYKIDPDLLIAITKAETNLGKVKQRGSDCNVGSVGSFDSTNTTYGCAGYRHGIEQIAQTLNNKLLGSHVAIAQLSGAGNPRGPVYATSTENWQRNVLATMSQLKGKPITPEYQFRIK